METARSTGSGVRAMARLAALCACIALAACSGQAPEEVVQQESNSGEFRIMPPSPLAGNELQLVWGNDAQSPRSSTAFASDESDGYSIIWQVNGNKIGRGHSLAAGLVRRGDRVSVHFEDDPEGHERAAVIIGNSPPEIRNVSVSRSERDPNLAVALFDARDADHDALKHHFEWTVDGELVEGHDLPELPLDGRSRGQEIVVRVSTSDGEFAASRSSSGALFENHPPAIDIAGAPRIVDREDGPWAELDLVTADADGDAVEVEVKGDVVWDDATSMISWKLAEGDEPFDVTIVATDARGASAERRTRLKR